jgi:hypothetical protein
MRNYIGFLLIAILAANGFSAVQAQEARVSGADDLHLRGKVMTSYQISSGEHILAFTEGFELSIGDNLLKSRQAIVWLNSQMTEYQGITNIEYRVKVYLEGNVSIEKGAGSKTTDLVLGTPDGELAKTVAGGVESTVAEFMVSGEVFATAENRVVQDVRDSQLYQNALVATGKIKSAPSEEPAVVQADSAGSPQAAEKPAVAKKAKKSAAAHKKEKPAAAKKAAAVKTKQPGIFGKSAKKQAKQPQQVKQVQQVKQAPKAGSALPPVPQAPPPKFQYPVNISGLGTEPVRMTNESLPDGTNIATILNRFYLWQKQDEQGGLLEFQANSAVIFYSRNSAGEPNDVNGLLAGNTVKAIYFRGDIIMTEGLRTIRADEAYYDLEKKQGLAVNAVMRNYDPFRGIPIYVRAAKLRQVSENKFKGENVTLTNSEFYVPRLAMTASEIVITDTTTVDEQTGKLGDQSYDAMMKNVKFKVNNKTVFWLPKIRTSLKRTDTAIRRASVGSDSDFGTSLETEWYLARVLGLRESAGVDSSLLLDYYSKRGVGAGAAIKYKRDDYFGVLDSYIIHDRGEDDLSRDREDIKPTTTLRGRFKWQHRQFLPYNWQLTLETSYLSDENYLEAFHRGEFLTDKEQETLIHLKRIKDNWAFAILGKWRINNFADQLEELPSAQYHLKAQSLFDDKVTLYHDSSVGRYRQRIGNNHSLPIVSSEDFTFASTRTELDMPLKVGSGSTKVVPYIAGTLGYDDRSGFARDLVTGTGTEFGSEKIFIGEFGVRASTQYHKTYKNARSRFWDINGLRHIVKPYINAAIFAESSSAVEQKDVFNLGVLQRWQTKRGVGNKERTVEWMRLNANFTWVGNDSAEPVRPDKFIWNNSSVPLSALSAPHIFNGDLGSPFRMFETFGMQRNSFNADYVWRISDTTAILSDLNYDVTGRNIEQFNIGFSRLRWPNLSYYIGARYLRSTDIDGEQGSNAFTFAATYKLNPRYSITFSHQYDFDYGERIASQVTLIRRYNRLFYGLTFSMDESLDRQAIVLSIWPEGVSELSIGSRRFMGLDAPQERND